MLHSLMRLQKIDMMHSLMSLHRKRLHCILDVSQISLRLTLLFLYDPILPKFLSYIVSQIILFWKSLSSNGQKKTSKSVVDLEALFQPFTILNNNLSLYILSQ